jgi:type VI secretion system secreted protein VgrG
MASQYGQSDRIAEVKTKLGDGVFLKRFTGSEGMSHLFEFRVECVAPDKPALDFDKQLGKNMTVIFRTNGHGDRYFTGTCTEAQRHGRATQGFDYTFILRPGLWVLSKRVNSRVFHNMKVPDILNEVFGEHSSLFTVEDKTQGNHPELEYCVQHRESDLSFVLRLMEGAGISYHFKFGDDSQTLVLCDSQSAYEAVPGGSRDYFDDEQFHVAERKEHFYRLAPERRFTANKAVLTDYKLQKPNEDNKGENEGDAKFDPKLEDYRHPYHQHLGKNTESDHGKTYAEVRVLSERSTDNHFLTAGDCGSLVPGYKVTIQKHPTDNGDYVVIGCAHTIDTQDYRTGGGGGGDLPYRGEYELMKLARFVPAIVTPKPIVGGPQTGVVVGDNTKGSDNEIHTDEYGRIKVHMHWNREDPGEAKGQTMWLRVAGVWTGQSKKWGSIFIPRVGTEVLVDYLDGDPDRPIVVGTVYNDKNKPPYDLPDKPFESGWKSNFESDGGYSEIFFVDTDGDEKIRVYTDKDLDTEVKNNEKRLVHVDREVEIKNNDTKMVGNELDVTAISKITFTVGTSKITMEPAQITIESTMVEIKANAMLKTQSNGVADHSAAGPMTIKGAIVTIN